MSADSSSTAGAVSAEGTISQQLDLTFSSTSSQTTYLLNGAVMLGNQYAPSGTIITALINNQARGQVSVNSAGQYSGLSIPVYASDSGKSITFSAVLDGVTYSTSQQVWIGSSGSGSGGVVLMSAFPFLQSSQTAYSPDIAGLF